MKAPIPVPKTAAQFTGMVVTAIVTFGTDLDVTYAVPLGIFAGALTVFFLSFAEAETEVQTRFLMVAPDGPTRLRRSSARWRYGPPDAP